MKVLINDIDVSSRCIYEIKITTGRADIESQPDASVCNLKLIGIGQEQIGQSLIVAIDDQFQIFHGIITDLTAQQSNQMEWKISVIATGPLRSIGNYSAGMDGWPEEQDPSRIARILDEIGIVHSVNPDVEGFTLLASVPERMNAGEELRKAADNGLGVLWEDPTTGLIRYLPARLRIWNSYQYSWHELIPNPWNSYSGNWHSFNSDDVSGSTTDYPGSITVDPSTANAEIVFEQAIGDLAKTVIVEYGIAPLDPEGNELERPTIISGTGEEPQVTYETDLAIEEEAEQFATTMVQRRQVPAWRLTQLILHAELLPLNLWLELKSKLSVGMRLTIPFPQGSPVGNQWEGYCEGWQHFIVGTKYKRQALDVSHSITLNVSDRQLTEPGYRWVDMIDSWSNVIGTWSIIESVG